MNRFERVGRGIVATSFAIVLAAISHVAAGAETPSLIAILVTVVVALPLSILLSGVRLSVPRLAAIVLASQALFHFSFALIGASPDTTAGPTAAHTGHMMAALSPLASFTTASSSDTVMWIAHALAAVATIVVLAFGERAAVALLTIVLAALAALRTHSLTLTSHWPTVVLPVRVDARPIALRIAQTHTRRGPPAYFV